MVIGRSSKRQAGFPGGSVVKNQLANAGYAGSNPRVRKIPWRRKWQPTPVLLPGEFHGERSLTCYRPWGRKRVGHSLVAEQQKETDRRLEQKVR